MADIHDAATRAQQAVAAMERAAVAADEDEKQLAFDALLYRLLVIGEAVQSLPADLLNQEPKVPWGEIARLRDLLAHHYYRVDPQIIRRTVDAPLRDLQAAARRLVDEPPSARRDCPAPEACLGESLHPSRTDLPVPAETTR